MCGVDRVAAGALARSDQNIVVNEVEGADHIAATRGDGYLFVYGAQGRRFTVNMGKSSGEKVKAYWYNPRTGTSAVIDTRRRSEEARGAGSGTASVIFTGNSDILPFTKPTNTQARR